jgi:hypothetical protein
MKIIDNAEIVDAQNHLFILKEAKEITDGTHSNN